MDPFVQASRRFSARAAMFWKLGKRPILRAVAPAPQTADLVQALRWEEAQPHCLRPLLVVTDPFPGEVPYFEAVTARIAEFYATLRTAAEQAGAMLPELPIPTSVEPVMAAVQAAQHAASLLPERLEGLAIALVPSAVIEPGAFAEQMSALVRVVTAHPGTGRRARFLVHETPGGPLRAVLGTGVDFALDEEALFDWWRGHMERGGGTPEDKQRRDAILNAARALRDHDPEEALRTLQAVVPEIATLLAPIEAPRAPAPSESTARVPTAMPRKVLPFARAAGEKAAHEGREQPARRPDVTRPLTVPAASPLLPFQPGSPAPDLFEGTAENEQGGAEVVHLKGAPDSSPRN